MLAGTAVLDDLERAIRTRDTAVPGRVLRRLVALQESLPATTKKLQDIDFDGFYVKLLSAADRGTRMGLARHWCAQTTPPRQALLLLALDRDASIATLVITSAKSLTENDLLEIAHRGSAPQWHALADHPALSAIVVDFLMVFADEETRTRIKSNPLAHWSAPAENLFNRRKNPAISGKNSPIGDKNPPKPVYPAPVKTTRSDYPAFSALSGFSETIPRRAALELATRLALHMLKRPAPPSAMLPALLTQDLAHHHHARLLARLALATDLTAEAVMRSFAAPDLRFFATLLWALAIPEILFDRLVALKQQAFPLAAPETAHLTTQHPLTPAQARQALQFFTRMQTTLKPDPAVWP